MKEQSTEELLKVKDYKQMEIGRIYYNDNTWFVWNGYLLIYRYVIDTSWRIFNKEEIEKYWNKKLIPTEKVLEELKTEV